MQISSFYLLSIFGLFPFLQQEKTLQNFLEKNCKPIITQDSLFQHGLLIPITEITQKGDELWITTAENYTSDELELVLSNTALESYPVQIFAKLVSTKKTKNLSSKTTNSFCFDIKTIKTIYVKAVLKVSGYKDAVRID